MAFKQRAALDRSDRMYKDAARKREIDEAALSNRPGGLQWALGTQEAGLKKRAADAHRNDLHQLNDFIEAATFKQKGDQAAIAAAKSIATQSVSMIGEWAIKKRAAEEAQKGREDAEEDKPDDTPDTDPVPIEPPKTPEDDESDSKGKEVLNRGFGIALPEDDSPETVVTKKDLNEAVNRKRTVQFVQAKEQFDNTGSLILTSQLNGAVRQTEAQSLYDSKLKGKTKWYKRAYVKSMTENLGQLYLEHERTSNKRLTIKVDGQDYEYNISDLNRHNGDNERLADLSPRFKLASIDDFTNKVLIPDLVRAVGADYVATNLIGNINKQVDEMKKEYKISWATGKNEENIADLRDQFNTAFFNVSTNPDDLDGLNVFKATIPQYIKAFQIYADRLGETDPKKVGLQWALDAAEASMKERIANGDRSGVEALINIPIPVEQVPWISPSRADADNNVTLGEAFPKVWSNEAVLEMEDKLVTDYVNGKLARNRADAQLGYENHIKLIESGATREEINQSLIEWNNRFARDHKELANKIRDNAYLRKNASNSYTWAKQQIALNGKLNRQDVSLMNEDAINQLKEEFEWDDIFEEVNIFKQASPDSVKKANTFLDDTVTKDLLGVATKDNINTLLTRRAIAHAKEILLPQEVRLLELDPQYKNASADVLVTKASEALAIKMVEGKDDPTSMWFVDSVNGLTKFEQHLSGSVETPKTAKIERGDILKLAGEHFSDLKGVPGVENPLLEPKAITGIRISDNRYKLNNAGHIDQIWVELEGSEWNTTGASALEIRNAWADANSDSIEIKIADPPNFKQADEDFKNRLGAKQVTTIAKRRDNQKLCSRVISDGKNGPVYGGTKDAVRAIRSLPANDAFGTPLRDLDPADLTVKWDTEILPYTIEYANKNNLNGGPRQLQRIAIAHFLGLNLDEVNAHGHRTLYEHPDVQRWHNIACTGGWL